MPWFRLRFVALATILIPFTFALAQQQQPGLPQPRLESVAPLGAKLGTSVELSLTGVDLEETEALVFSHPGIKAERLPEPEPPMADPKDPKKQPPKADPKKNAPLPTKFKVTVPPEVPPGFYDVRAVNKFGVSNPRVFTVGDLNEVSEKEPNNDAPEAQKVELNTTVNGSIASPTDVDYYSFPGKKGQRVLAACLATSIDSKARPEVRFISPTGRELALNHNYSAGDAVTDVVLPEDGDYIVRVAEFTYTQGGPQFFYRLSITTAPWIDAVVPPVVEPGKPSQVTLYGRNLPGGTPDPSVQIGGRPMEKLAVTVTPPSDPLSIQRLNYRGYIEPKLSGLDGFEYRIKGPAGTSNPVLIALAREKLVAENDANDTPATAQEVPVPCEVAGQINKRADRDWYAFNAKKGESYWIELTGDRLGAQTFLFLTLHNPAAKADIIELEDNPNDFMHQQQFYTRHGDPPAYKFTAPADGKYLVRVAGRESSFYFGPRVNYTLRISTGKPDFRLVVMPPSDNQPDAAILRPDGNQFYDVFVWRTEGFKDAITLVAEGLPAGVTCPPGQVIGANMKQGILVLAAAADAAPFVGTITVKGTATINGQPVVREARAATVTWPVQAQQGIPSLVRLDQGLFLAVRDKAPFRVTAEPENAFVKKEEKLPQPLAVKQGEKLTVPFKVARNNPEAKQITLQQLGSQQTIQASPVTVNNGQPLPAVAADKNDGAFVIDVKTNAPPGPYTVTLRAQAQFPYDKDPMGKNKKPVTVILPVSPVTVNVIPASVAKVNLAGPNGKIKQKESGEVVVKVERQNDYTGEFKVKLILPMGAKGVTADEVTIPAGQNETKLVLKAAADAPGGLMNNLIVQVVANYEGKYPLTQEAKLNINIEKAPEPKKEEPKKEEPKKDPPKNEEPKKDAAKKDEPKKEPAKKEEPKKN
jgi:Bacterial pre-peptidase C-terminal domain